MFPHVWATCRHSNQAPTWWRTSPFWPLSPERRYYAETVFHTCHETSRATQTLHIPRISFRMMSTWYLTSGSSATRAHASSVGERVTQSPLKSPFFTHSPPRPPNIECSERTAMAHPFYFFSFVFSHVWATCRHSNHSPTRSGTPYPGPFRLRGATVRKRFPTNCTRPPVRSKARAWCRSLFARCPHDT